VGWQKESSMSWFFDEIEKELDEQERARHQQAQAPAKASRPLSERLYIWKVAGPYVLCAAGGCFATACVHFLDVIKTRIQVQGEGRSQVDIEDYNMFLIGKDIAENEGYQAFFKGLPAALLRQAVSEVTRMMTYHYLSTKYFADAKGNTSYWKKALSSVLADCASTFVGNPADVIAIREQADATLPFWQQRRYTNLMDAFYRLAFEDGIVRGIFAGIIPNLTKTVALSSALILCYDPIKWVLEWFVKKDSHVSVISAGVVAAYYGSYVSISSDFVKTRMQKQKAFLNGTFPYSNAFDCVARVNQSEGPSAFNHGFGAYFVRTASHALIHWYTVSIFDTIATLK
jgi:hypothetical protein